MITERYKYEPIPRENVNGSRHYCTPDGNKLPSVTTILDKTKPAADKQALANWRAAVGQQRAQAITTEAANRGTRVHSYLEHYIKTDQFKEFPSNPYAQQSWHMAAQLVLSYFDDIDECWGTEVPLYYPQLYAGTTDFVGQWKSLPAIVDFKQSNKPKKKEWIADYFLQLAAYAMAHNQVHNTSINTGVILMAVKPDMQDGLITTTPQVQQFVITGSEFDHWSEQWINRVDQYYSMR